jgi:ATP-dependent protease ClpP protease subunit
MLLKSAADSMHVTLAVNGSMRAALPEANLMIHGTGMRVQTANVTVAYFSALQ